MKNKILLIIITLFVFLSCHTTPATAGGLTETETQQEEKNQPIAFKPEEKKPEEKKQDEKKQDDKKKEDKKQEDKKQAAVKIPEYTVTFAAVGDNLFHDSVINYHYINGVHDFSPIYSEVKEIIQNADLAFINQETVMAGASFGYSGYPAFNTPQSLAVTLKETGFDIINLANNHAMDKGEAGLLATLDYLSTFEEFTVIGARRQGESARIITKNNITFGFLSYTYGLNGIPLPKNNPNIVSLINKDKMSEEIKALRPLCDFLIVSMHWGAEYLLEPDRSQTSLALFLAEHDVDLIIGHHPHVLQKVDTIVLPDGRKTLCYYSLGNFASHQGERDRMIGGMMILTFKKIGDELFIIDPGMIPVITHISRNYRLTKVYPLYSYSKELTDAHALLNKGMSMEFFNATADRLNTKIFTSNPFIEQ